MRSPPAISPAPWGDPSQRQGTHDYYNQNGLEVFTWNSGSRSIVVMGDAHMRLEDAEIAAATVRTSLEQVLDVASDRSGGLSFAHPGGTVRTRWV